MPGLFDQQTPITVNLDGKTLFESAAMVSKELSECMGTLSKFPTQTHNAKMLQETKDTVDTQRGITADKTVTAANNMGMFKSGVRPDQQTTAQTEKIETTIQNRV